MKSLSTQSDVLHHLIDEYLTPYVRQIDTEAFYAEKYLREIGKQGLFLKKDIPLQKRLQHEMELVLQTAKVCMTTAFCLWCHLAALTYIRHTNNKYLQAEFLPKLETGKLLAGTGLSNPLKHFAGLEKIQLRAKEVENGYILNGSLPYISNLRKSHRLAIISKCDSGKKVMCFIPCSVNGFEKRERTDYLGLNGSATHVCILKDVFVPYDWVISEDVETFVERVRSQFIAYQIPLGLGVIQSSIDSIERVKNKQNGCNAYLPIQAEDLNLKIEKLQFLLNDAIAKGLSDWKEISQIRLDTAYVTLEAVQAAMLHNGSSGYIKNSTPSRKLREAYFFANLTPTVKHLEKVL